MYRPTERDLLWAKTMLELINNNGVLAYPETGLVYKLDHRNKVLELQNVERLNQSTNAMIVHHRTIIVFKVLGYVVTEKEENK